MYTASRCTLDAISQLAINVFRHITALRASDRRMVLYIRQIHTEFSNRLVRARSTKQDTSARRTIASRISGASKTSAMSATDRSKCAVTICLNARHNKEPLAKGQ